MLKKLFHDIGPTEVLGLIILCSLTALYFYFNPVTIRKSEIQEVDIILSKKAEFFPETHEFSAYLKLVDDNFNRSFELKDCSLELIDKLDLLKLNAGDKLQLSVKRNEVNSGKTIVNNFISIYGIKLANGERILSLESYNSCKKNYWKKFGVLGGLLLLLLVGGSIKKMKKNAG